jgi:hypothetical protein
MHARDREQYKLGAERGLFTAEKERLVDDHDIVEHISQLVDEEHQLRSHSGGGRGLNVEEQERVRELEVQLDQCWDLLRRRQAREEFGQDPNLESERPASVVEHYRQ